MVSIFHDYAISLKDPALARQYYNYADRAAEIDRSTSTRISEAMASCCRHVQGTVVRQVLPTGRSYRQAPRLTKAAAFGTKEQRAARRAAARDEEVTDTLFSVHVRLRGN